MFEPITECLCVTYAVHELQVFLLAIMEDAGELLIHEVGKNEVLYDKRHAAYKDIMDPIFSLDSFFLPPIHRVPTTWKILEKIAVMEKS